MTRLWFHMIFHSMTTLSRTNSFTPENRPIINFQGVCISVCISQACHLAYLQAPDIPLPRSVTTTAVVKRRIQRRAATPRSPVRTSHGNDPRHKDVARWKLPDLLGRLVVLSWKHMGVAGLLPSVISWLQQDNYKNIYPKTQFLEGDVIFLALNKPYGSFLLKLNFIFTIGKPLFLDFSFNKGLIGPIKTPMIFGAGRFQPKTLAP